MSLAETVVIRDATIDDVDFLSWVMLAASRSHLPRGLWEYINNQTGDQTQAYLARAAVTDTVHFCHWSLFLVAEVGGTPAAAMCGFDPDVHGFNAMMSIMPSISEGIVFDEGLSQRAANVSNAVPPYESGRWVVENVATLPEFRRRGLVDTLLRAILDRGRDSGFDTAQIGVFIGNTPAKEAYLKVGFEYELEKRDANFEADMGCPGMERLVRSL